MTPYALGQEVNFIKGQGPKLSDFIIEKFLDNTEKNFSQKLNQVYKAIEKTRKKLPKEKSLIAFVGAPWTLLIYMFNINKEKKKSEINKIIDKKNNIKNILDKLINFLCVHIKNQIEAGADVVQVFDPGLD